MHRKLVVSFVILAAISVAGYIVLSRVAAKSGAGFVTTASDGVTQGALQVIDPEKGPVGLCPLKHTDVKAEVSGFLGRVVVTQEFENPFKDKIEAVYTFPLPQNAAVDDMTMVVGARTVRGRIKPREEARAVYEAARAAGHVSSLLDQERPNIFTQSVANIAPGEQVKVTISYVEMLKYEDGSYEFVFPMVVGPRYIPGSPVGKQGGGWAPNTDRVPDASRVTPQVAPPGKRSGHDISIEVAFDAGVPIDSLRSTLHDTDIERPSGHSAIARLRNRAEIPNKDFILKCDVAGGKIEDAVLTHHSPLGGFFTMILQPPERVTAADVTPKELVFVLDTSGSMSGFPIEKAKETMKLALDGLYPQDTFNLITFAGDTHVLFSRPVPATAENLRKAQAFLASRSGSGGTEMMQAIKTALDPSDSADHIRIVCFMTDGYVGNDMEIISEVQKHPNARVFAFGIGGSVNRFLLDKMAEHGRGEVEYVALRDDGSAAARRFHERVRSPLLTDISIDWSGAPVTEVYPKRVPDLFSAKPVIMCGRYTGGGRGVIRLKGRLAGDDFVREIPIELPDSEPRHDVLAKLWARSRIDELMARDYNGIQQGNPRQEVREAITQLGLEFRLMTQFTSFVAVEEMIVTDGGQPRRVEVPVEMPEGVRYEGVFGDVNQGASLARTPTFSSSVGGLAGQVAKSSTGSAAGSGPGSGRGIGSGSGAGAARPGTPSSKPVATSGPPSPPSPAPPAGLTAAEQSGLSSKADRISFEDAKRQQLISKLHPSIAALVARLKDKNFKPAADEARFVRDGKAEIQVWLSDKSPETLAQLKQLGFEVVADPKTAKMIIGRLPIEKLAALAELKSVRYIAPMTQ